MKKMKLQQCSGNGTAADSIPLKRIKEQLTQPTQK